MPLFKIVIPSANKIVRLQSRDPRNARARVAGWRYNYPDAYLLQGVEVTADDGSVYVLSYQPVPLIGGW